MLIKEEKNGLYKGYLREIEVVEHRDEKRTLLDRIKTKLNKPYSGDTVLVCHILTPKIYDFIRLAKDLASMDFNLSHAFLVFRGRKLENIPLDNNINFCFSLVQLLPEFRENFFDLREQAEDFKKKFEVGQEMRGIENGGLYYKTRNLKFFSKTNKS